MVACLYVAKGSKGSATVEMALQLRGMYYERVEIGRSQQAVHSLLRRNDSKLPALQLESGEVLFGDSAIRDYLSNLDVYRASASEPTPSAAVSPEFSTSESIDDLYEEFILAESWGREVVNPATRRVLLYAISIAPGSKVSFSTDHRSQQITSFAGLSQSSQSVHSPKRGTVLSPQVIKADLDNLPHFLGRIDRYIESGVLGNGTPSKADYVIAECVAHLMTLEDLAGRIEYGNLPSAWLGSEYFPNLSGRIPANSLPTSWLWDPFPYEPPSTQKGLKLSSNH